MSHRTNRLVAPLVGLLLWVPLAAGPTVRLVKQDRISLDVRSLSAPAVGDQVIHLEAIRPSQEGQARFEVAWPTPESRSVVQLRAVPLPPAPGAEATVRLDAEVVLPDGRKVRSTRVLAFKGSFTALFEVYREQDRPLTLAIEAAHVQETVPGRRGPIGPPVELMLEVQYVNGEQATTLESNRLTTFVGEPVSYAFSLGDRSEAASLQIELTPLKLQGDLAEVKMEVTGTLPGDGELMVISRAEDWMMSRGTSSNLSVVSGTPPVGFRFRVTPSF